MCFIIFLKLLFWKLNIQTHQWGFTEQLAASDQVSDGDVEVRVATAPVGDLSEEVSGEDVLQEI